MIEVNVQSGERKELVLVHKTPESQEHVIRLAGEGAEVHIQEIFLADNVKSNITIIHDAKNTTSRLHARGVVGKAQHAVSHAKVIMPKHAQLSDSLVKQNFLLLDKSAEAEAIPSLEIEADDVKAAHAATISPIDEEKLFYLTSRGLPEKEAQKLIIEGFLNIPEGHEGVIEQWQK